MSSENNQIDIHEAEKSIANLLDYGMDEIMLPSKNKISFLVIYPSFTLEQLEAIVSLMKSIK